MCEDDETHQFTDFYCFYETDRHHHYIDTIKVQHTPASSAINLEPDLLSKSPFAFIGRSSDPDELSDDVHFQTLVYSDYNEVQTSLYDGLADVALHS